MKKLLLILSFIPILSLHAQDSDKAIIDDLKYIVAYHLNCLSLEENKKGNEEFVESFKKELGTGERVMTNMNAKLSNSKFTKNRDLCNQIARLSVPAKSYEELNTYFKEDFFNIKEGEIYNFLSKRNNDKAKMDKLKREISDAIDEYLADKNYPVTNSEEVIALSDVSKGTKEMKKDEPNRETAVSSLLPTFLTGLSALLFIGLLVLGYISHKLRKEKNTLEIDLLNKKDEIAILRKDNEKYFKEADKFRRDNDKLENENSRLRRQLEEKDKEKKVTTAQSQSNILTNRMETVKPVIRISFVGVPRNGTFVGEFDSYKPGKCLYKVISADGHYGTFEFYNSIESLDIVKQSRTEFLEPACNIKNLDDSTFNKIDTLKEGRVEKINNVWRIIEKADIELK